MQSRAAEGKEDVSIYSKGDTFVCNVCSSEKLRKGVC